MFLKSYDKCNIFCELDIVSGLVDLILLVFL